MLAVLVLLASAPLPTATAEEGRVTRELDRLQLSTHPRYPGGPAVAVLSTGHPPPAAVRLLQALPALVRFSVTLPPPDDATLDLSRVTRLRGVRLPSQYLDGRLKLPPGLRELSLTAAGRGPGWAERQPQSADRESAEVVRLVAGLTQLEALDLSDCPLSPRWGRRLASRSLTRLSLHAAPADLSLLPALEELTVGTADRAGLEVVAGHPGLRSLTVAAPLDDPALEVIGRMKRLERLTLDHQGLTDRGLAALRGLNELRALRLTGRPSADGIGDAGLTFLRGLKRLETLQLSDTRLTDDGLASLAGLPRLRELSLEGNRITGPGLAHLAGLPVERLSLAGEPLRTDGLRHLAALPRLRELDLSSSGEGRDLTPGLGGVRSLQVLSLNYTGATDGGLAKLAALSELRELRLHETRVSAEAADQLRRTRPGLHVHRPEPGR